MRVRRFGPPDGPLAGVEINYLLISFGALLRHLRKLPGIAIRRTQVWLPTDDHWAELEYKGVTIWISSEFVDFDVCPGEDCPPELFLEVVNHLEGYRPWAINRLLAAASERSRQWKLDVHEAGRRSVLGRGRDGGQDPPPRG